MIDLHIHSKYSDGTDSIDDILNIASVKKVPLISLTDHDTTMGVAELLKKSEGTNVGIVPGVEISSVSNGHMIHILGYNIDINNSQLQDLLKVIEKYVSTTFYDMCVWLYNNRVIDYDVDKIMEFSSFKQSFSPSDILKAMIAGGYPYTFKDWPAFFNKIKHHPSTFIENFPVHPSEAVEVIGAAKGISSFAHPARIGDSDLKEMKLLVPYGLRGVEVYYPFHDKELIVRYENFAAENSLLKTGGTDWHGQDFTTWNVEIGDFGIKESPQSIESYFI